MRLPLFACADPERPVLWARGHPVSVTQLMERVAAVARVLPEGRHVINLCERRDAFITAFCAALVRGQTNVLPWSRAENVVAEVTALNSGSCLCRDELVESALESDGALPQSRGEARSPRDGLHAECLSPALDIPSEQVAAVAFTSGSTGVPQGHAKPWRSFSNSSRLTGARIRECLSGEYGLARPFIVATVPPQHMYGLETSVLLPLLADMAVHAGRPLLPADVAAALAEVPEPRVLVTAPVHMRAIVESGQAFPRTALVISATAPLEPDLARRMERQLGTTVLEIFGSTETCAIATRRTARETSWSPYPGVALEPDPEGVRVDAPWFAAPVRLQDLIEVMPGNGFVVRGRGADMIEVAGKRASLADLTRRLLAIPGVRDAVVFQPESAACGRARRVAALVVAPDLSSEAICRQLARELDPAFMPRPLVRVGSLPRNEAGKLPRERLLAAIASAAPGRF